MIIRYGTLGLGGNVMAEDKNSMWIYGRHAVVAAARNKRRKIIKLAVLSQNEELIQELQSFINEIDVVSKDFFVNHFGKDVIHQGCAALVTKLDEIYLEDLSDDDSPLLFLDQVTDPQNIGSILRAAAVFGAKAVVLPEANTPGLTSAMIKVASGAAERVPLIKVKNLVQSIRFLQQRGYWCLGLDEHADKQIYQTDLRGKFIIVVGSEGRGMRRLTREVCDFLVQLPSFGSFSTLNAAQAATVSLYEYLKQNRGD
ncbi:MAG: 23S rRNA (guanosine(2251)-2'-O)-methyltransferase RlmB [Alphaproteobacteria bacterium]|nr:23S rRNA (guanosine(2251)-2'-O)-methyltransferase RlmB [Alphaproteobacteria bacterium]